MEKLDVQIQPKLKKIALYTLIFMVLLHGYRYVSLGFYMIRLPLHGSRIWNGRFRSDGICSRFTGGSFAGALPRRSSWACFYGYMVGSVYGVASLLDLKAKRRSFCWRG